MAKISSKNYKCTQCGHKSVQSTNHYGNTYSWGRYNTCSNCPPYKKHSEFGGSTTWECIDIDYSKISCVEVEGVDSSDYPKFCDAFIASAEYNGKPMTEEQLEELDSDWVHEQVMESLI